MADRGKLDRADTGRVVTVESVHYPAAALVIARKGRSAEAATRLGTETGLTVVDGPASAANERTMIWGVAPGRWLVLQMQGDRDLPTMLSAALADCGSVFDQSSATAMWRLTGAAVAPLLQKGLFVDLDPQRFPVGRCCTALLAHMAVTAARTDAATWHVAVPRSYGEHFRHWLTTVSDNARVRLDMPVQKDGTSASALAQPQPISSGDRP